MRQVSRPAENREYDENVAFQSRKISYRQLIRFFLPLGATPLFIGSVHSLINAALARLPAPEVSLAVFTVIKSMTSVISAPTFMTRQIFVSLVDDLASYRLAQKFVWTICAISFGFLLFLGYTPAGAWVFQNIIGLRGAQQMAFAYACVRVTAFHPVVEVLRNSYQGVAIGLEKTDIMFMAIVIRLAGIIAFLWWAVRSEFLSGAVVGGLAWIAGMGIEGLVVLAFLVYYFKGPSRAVSMLPERAEGSLFVVDIFKFFLPLAVMQYLSTFLQPLIQSGIARSPVSPTQSLAAYGVAWSIITIIVGPLRMLHQCSLVYTGRDRADNWERVRKFCLILGFSTSIFTLIFALSPVSIWLFEQVIGVSRPVAEIAGMVLGAFSAYPFFAAWRDAYWGALMGRRNTKVIATAKLANLFTVSFLLFFVIGGFSPLVNLQPALAGAGAFAAGEGVETLFVWRYCSQSDRFEREL